MDQIEIHWVWWVVAAVALGVLEVLTLDLVLLMFAAGATAALVASLLGANITVQVLVFAGVSTFMLVVLRPFLLRNLRRSAPLVETNTAAHVGRTALTLTEVTDRSGLIKLVGEQWSARSSQTGVVHPADVTVRVVRIDGATAVVGPLQDPDEDPPHAPGTSP
ncbi:NfeD family protein [Actinotalea sp. AC32]|nr:NfeD family protein [Actinotalea sp. AC32]